MKVLLGNVFDLTMLPDGKSVSVSCVPITRDRLLQDFSFLESRGIDIQSVVGHADIASAMSSFLSREVSCNFEPEKVYPGDALYVTQLVGSHPSPGASFECYLVTFCYNDFRHFFVGDSLI